MKSVILVVLDGLGIAPPGPGNAVYLANPSNLNSYFYSYPNTTLRASGESVGLPTREVGNTEVGHINLGAGRIVYQDLPRINLSIADGSFYKNESFLQGIEHLKKTGGKLHFLGLIGEGTVHSSIDHLFALLHLAKEHNVTQLFLHVITDGRDSPPKSAEGLIMRIEQQFKTLGIGKIATVVGRYFAMDRDRRWERTQKAYECYAKGIAEHATTAIEAVQKAYSRNKTDEFIEPTIIASQETPQALIESGDTVIFFNYRIDRPRQLTKAFVLDHFEEEANKSFSFDPYAVKYYKTHYPKEEIVGKPFQRGPKIKDIFFITMTEYEKTLPTSVAYPPTSVSMPLGRTISEQGLFQLRMAESEKERFVTYYFNGQNETPFPNEDRIIIPSPKVPTYDLKPEMSAFELTDILIQKMYEQKYSFILLNFANPDMVGHTGNIEASIQAVRVVDSCIGKIVSVASDLGNTLLITADHGNVEQKVNPATGQISTEHTANPVPFIAIRNEWQGKLTKLQTGILADVAPTVLSLLKIPKPAEMAGRNLLDDFK